MMKRDPFQTAEFKEEKKRGGSASTQTPLRIFEEIISFLHFLQQQHKQGGFHQQHPQPGFRVGAPLDPTALREATLFPTASSQAALTSTDSAAPPHLLAPALCLTVFFQSHFLLPVDPFVQTDRLWSFGGELWPHVSVFCRVKLFRGFGTRSADDVIIVIDLFINRKLEEKSPAEIWRDVAGRRRQRREGESRQ